VRPDTAPRLPDVPSFHLLGHRSPDGGFGV
jgi:hypothetical protein